MVVDPNTSSAGFVCEKAGGLFERYTYAHTVLTRRPGIACLQLVPVPSERDEVKMELAVTASTPIGLRPTFVDKLFADGAETEEEQELSFKVRVR